MLPQFNEKSFHLTIEQQLEIRKMKDAVTRLSREQLETMIIEALQLNFIYRNLLNPKNR